MKNLSKMFFLGLAVMGLMIIYTVYVLLQNSALSAELKDVDAEYKAQANLLLQYENKKILEAVSAKEVLNRLTSDEVKWSNVIRSIRQTLPNDLVEILSYSGSVGNEISLNVKTKVNSENAYIDVAKLIAAFAKSSDFEDAFVPSISSGVDQEGNDVLTFLLNTKFVGSDDLPINTGITR
ncbi:hypothetical protein COU74_04650 [Candidatus Peregrinibacteria bacterium CG10_big_fil_rev_8_21_14_0_10_36_19]|nr:MAG: hypothetical protein COU74_04650 [Candidatus Peregrinibacteria bacterium CG10_big_fil_rev_8_21_14_0_10_36_19]